MTTLSFDGDLRAHVYVSWLNPFKEQKLTVVGSSGMAVFDDTKPWEDKLLLYRNHVTWSDGKIPTANQVEGERVDIPQREPLKDECVHFLVCCDQRITPRTDGMEGLRVLKVLQAAQASMNEEGEAKDPASEHLISLDDKVPYFAHPSAVIDAGAEIGADVKIWHFSHVMGGSKLGRRCNIGQNVVISSGVELGENVKIQNNVSVYSGVHCEDNVFIGPSAVFTNIKNPRSDIPRRDSYVHTVVKEGATIGANSTIVCGIELGSYAFIGAGAVVTKNVKPYALIIGNPGRQVGWMSRYGERLDLPVRLPENETQQVTCPHTGDVYELKGDSLSLIGNDSVVDVEAEETASV
jgi:UDP-2-acetamido-3-amino-2,3-dideoxy-glucuronate N-acetyltransferase